MSEKLRKTSHRRHRNDRRKACQKWRLRKVRCVKLDSMEGCVNCNVNEQTCSFLAYDTDRLIRSEFDQSPEYEDMLWQSFDDVAQPDGKVVALLSARFFDSDSTGTPMPYQHHKGFSFLQELLDLSVAEAPLKMGMLPSFIRPPHGILDAENSGFNDALLIPPEPLRSMLLKAYIYHIYPLAPLFDTRGILLSMTGQASLHGQISLLLFQAIMFAGSLVVDEQELASHGIQHNMAYCQQYFTRVLTLYRSGVENDRLVVAQTLILMAMWYEGTNPSIQGTFWLDSAVHIFRSDEVLTNFTHTALNCSLKRIWRRTWWSWYIIDTVLALCCGFKPLMSCNYNDIPMLTLEDFEILDDSAIILPESLAELITTFDVCYQKSIATLCIERAKLCICVRQILHGHYVVRTPFQKRNVTEDPPLDFQPLCPRQLSDTETLYIASFTSLGYWASSQKIHPSLGAALDIGDFPHWSCKIAHIFTSSLYFAAIIVLHRPRSVRRSPTLSQHDQTLIQTQIKFASFRITHMLMMLQQDKEVSYLAPYFLATMVLAAATQLTFVVSTINEDRLQSTHWFMQSYRLLQRLDKINPSATAGMMFLSSLQNCIFSTS